jgi:hypothetical protein
MYIHILAYCKLFPYFNINRYPTKEALSQQIKENEQRVVRKDSNVNEHERLSDNTLRLK